MNPVSEMRLTVIMIGLCAIVAFGLNVAYQVSNENDTWVSDMEQSRIKHEAVMEKRVNERRTLRSRLMTQCLTDRQEYYCTGTVEASVDAALPIDEKYRHIR